MSNFIERSSKKQLLTIAGLIVALLLIFNVVQLYMSSKDQQVIAEKTEEVKEANDLNEELQEEFDDAMEQLNAALGENEELDAIIEKQKVELEKEKQRISRMIRNGNATKKDLTAAKAQIDSLIAENKQFLAKIEEQKAQIETLEVDKATLETRTEELTQVVEMEKTTSENLRAAKETLETEKQELTKAKDDLTEKASVISVNNFSLQGFKVTSRGNLRKRDKAKNIDLLRMQFKTAVNQVAQNGKEDFYVRIISPLGETLALQGTGSGVFTNRKTGDQFRYTTLKTVDYDKSNQEVTIDWEPSTPFTKGKYLIEIYNKGYLSGSSEFLME